MGRTKRAAGSVLLLFCSVVRSPLLCLEKHDQSSGQWPHRTEQKLFLVSLMKEVRVCTRPSLLHNSGGRSLFLGDREPRQEQDRGQDQGLRYRPVRSNRRVRCRYTGPVWPETGPNRSKSNLNLKFSVQTIRTGILAGLTGNPPNLIFFV